MGAFACEECEKVFSKSSSLKRHHKAVHGDNKYICEICGEQFKRQDIFRRHVRLVHSSSGTEGNVNSSENRANMPLEDMLTAGSSTMNTPSFMYCKECNSQICSKEWKYHLRTNLHKKNAAQPLSDVLKVVKSSLNGRIETILYENKDESIIDPLEFLKVSKSTVLRALNDILKKHQSIKFNMELFNEYIKMTKGTDEEDDQFEVSMKSFQAKMNIANREEDLDSSYDEMMAKIVTKMQEFQERDSGWSLIRIIHLEINVNEYKPLRGSQYLPLPKFIAQKHACINVQNNDEFCFKWAVISALQPIDSNSNRTSSYEINDIGASTIMLKNGIRLNFGELEFPLKVLDIKYFEEMNPSISVNVFGYEKTGADSNKIVGPYYYTKDEKNIHINLLLFQVENKSHYVWIKNLPRLVSSQIALSKRKIYLCNTCLSHFYSKEALDIHRPECSRIVTIMPSQEKSCLKFENYERQLQVPFVIYSDFECLLKDVSTCIPNPCVSSTTNVQEHIPCAFSYNIKCSYDDNLSKFKMYKGKDSASKFILSLVDDVKNIYYKYITNPKKMNPLTNVEINHQKYSKNCHICNLELTNDRVADHCHLTGKYRGPAHRDCNLKYRVPKFFPIFFHNFSGYDCHLFIKQLEKIEGDIKVIPLNKERYISLSKRVHVNETDTIELRFLDSSRFMQSSLDALARNLTDNDFCSVKAAYNDEESFKLLMRKGVFPYEYINDWGRLEETCLPPRNKFHNKLTNSKCSHEDYHHANKVWEKFKCKNLWDYLEVYLKTDVLLLTDIFENFRKVCRKIYALDPCQYYTAPGLSWDAMLKVTQIKLELLVDINMYNFFKRGIRGGITQCSLRHSRANNKYLTHFDKCKPSRYLVYLDANNLYGWAMSQPLPHSGFKWIETQNFDVLKIPENSDSGYILEVDLEYPKSKHDDHNDLPFCAENKKSPNAKFPKLITDLTNKSHYIIHYRNLQQCLNQGLKLLRIHRILEFKQSCWLKSYIDLNTYYRTIATNAFEKNFFKLLNNAVFGKTMENVDKRKTVKIVTNWESSGKKLGARALIAKPNFHSLAQFTDDMVAIQLSNVKCYYNKPMYIGFTVLELSKWKMYSFHYNYMKPKYDESVILNYMDTDSFVYTIQTEDFYKDITNDIDQYFDTSDYTVNNPFKIPPKNKKVLGYMKDEANGKIIKEFIGLRAKMYSIDIDNTDIIKKAKGIKKAVLDGITLDNYRDCLYRKKILYGNMFIFRSKVHHLYTQCINKVSLSYLDDKRHIKDDGISTYAWGHYRLREKMNVLQ